MLTLKEISVCTYTNSTHITAYIHCTYTTIHIQLYQHNSYSDKTQHNVINVNTISGSCKLEL